MPPLDPAGQAGHPEPDGEPKTRSTRRVVRDRHGRRERTAPATKATVPRSTTGPRTTGPRWTVGPPKTVPMTVEQYQRAVQAWAMLIASWWTDNPPNQEQEDEA
jgi:hypothetical protein